MSQELGLSTFLSLASGYNWGGVAYAVFIVFCRLGGFFSILPGFGEMTLSPKLRLMLSVSCAFGFYSLLIPNGSLPIPSKPTDFLMQISLELLVGVIMGSFIRILYEALNIAGAYIAQMVGLSNIFDTSMSSEGATAISRFLVLSGIVLLFISGIHYTFIKIILNSYSVFPLFSGIDLGIASKNMISLTEKSFSLGLQFALPFIIVGWTLNMGMGFINKIMPQMPVFFIGQALIIFTGLILMAFIMPHLLTTWLSIFTNLISEFM
jgi:flagellar biosynthesis protein FliR